ncbi:MAG: FapA family protein [Spirochaetaceae bacterium]|nr:FapA family protein [Spirochaetaceae bacterium]
MIDFAKLTEIVKKRLEEDLEIKSVEVEMPTLEEAVHEAAAILGIPIKNLDYEVLVHKTIFMGFGKNVCKIRGYESAEIKRKKEEEAAAAAQEMKKLEEVEEIKDIDGEVFIKRISEGVFIKVVPPLGEGRPAHIEDAKHKLSKLKLTKFDENLLNQAIEKQANEYIRIGDYSNNPANNAMLSLDVTKDEMRAFIQATPPGQNGADIMLSGIKQVLEMHGVISGFDEKFLSEFADNPIYNERICIAKGRLPIDGSNSYMEYFFEIDQTKIKLKESEDGRIDFKETNIIQNIHQDEKIAIWHPAEKGENGETVTGRILMAQPGKDGVLEIGENVRLAPDGKTIIANINGQVILKNGKINVESIYEVEGDVNLKTGNIKFLGNVFIKGDVLEGFTVEASGNIEVNGAVNKATLIAEGDIIVKQGIYGKEGAVIKSNRSVWAKFIENATIKSGNIVVVSDGIINSYVDASKKILCQGRRASIVGGRLRASEEINCKTLGAVGGSSETICEVAYDPHSKSELEDLSREWETTASEFDDVLLNVQTLENHKNQHGGLTPDREEFFNQLLNKKSDLSKKIKELDEKIRELQDRLSSLTTLGRVSAAAKVYPNVVICIRDAKEKIRKEYKATSFILEQGLVRTTKYIESGTEKPPS